ncbi:hypothetical protein CBS147339_8489 [Penicillium roqueforti]|nr:hypothetical protein DTO012A8_9355 [Penicillium roqueforti]KAI3067534.1 hypothetical protein CBS147339_8489 [Penicillium roqueforti]KAI3090543.1 hypothetical protein CBS147338_8862 [Penicillium roqueforti]KAI3129937.1 hypothetical protein CBS147325_9456 [Penicillium roqueforti]KAI3152961.1 hypothetical protein DTO046C5_8881 [Penicillium roqueforti]
MLNPWPFPSITSSNGTVGIIPRRVFANDKRMVLVSEGIFRQSNDSGDQSTSLRALTAHSTGITLARHQNIETSKSASLSFCASTPSPRIFSFSRSRSSISIAPMSMTEIPSLSLTPMSRSDGRE